MANRYWVGGTGTWTTTTTNWSATSGGTAGASAPTAADAVFFDQAATYTVTMTGALLCLDITVSAGTVTFTSTGTLAVSGSMSLLAGTLWSATGTITFNATTSKTITTNAVTINSPITFAGVGGTWTLGSNLTLGLTLTTTLTNGTISLSTFTLSTGIFSSAGTAARSINFGTGTIDLTHTTLGTIVLAMATATLFTVSGAGGFTSAMSVTRTFQFGSTAGGSATNSPNLSLTSGASIPTLSAASWFNTLNFNGSTCTPAATTLNLNGLTLASGGTYTNLTPTMVGTGTITSNTNTTLASLTIASTSGTTTLGDTFTLTLTSTTTLTSGTLALSTFTLSTGIFSSSGLVTRAISFGTGSIALTHTTAATTVLSMATVTGFTYTGTGGFTSAMSVTRTFTFGTTGGSATNSPNLSLTSGASIPTLTTGSWFNTLNFTGSTCTPAVTALNLNGLTLALGGTYTNLTPTMVGTGTITSSGNTTLAALTIASTSGTTTVGDTFTLTLTSTTTLTSGTLALGTNTLSTGIFSSSGTLTRVISFGIGNIALTHTTAGTTVLSMATATGFTWQYATGTPGFTSAMANTRIFTFGTTGGSITNAPNLTLSGASIATLTTGSWFSTLDFTTSTFNPGTTTLNLNVLTLSSGVGAVYTTMTVNMVGTGGITSNGNTTLGPLIINNGANTTTVTTLTCTTFTMTAGTINFASSFTFTCSGTATYTAGTLSNLGTISCATFIINGPTFTLSSGTINASTSFVLQSGSFTLGSGGTLSAVPTFTHTAGTVTLGKAYALTATGTYTLTAGTLTLNGFDLTTGIFSSSGLVTRAISFGTGSIALTHTTAATTVLSMATVTGFTYTGTGGFQTDATTVTRTVAFGTTGGSATNAPNLTLTGSGTNVITCATGSWFKTLSFGTTAFNPGTTALSIAGDLTLSSGGTFTGLTLTMVGTGTITNNTKTIAALTINSTSGTATLSAALTVTGTTTLTNGTLNLANFTITTAIFSSTNTNTRSITFGTGTILLSNSTAATILSMANATNFTCDNTSAGGFVVASVGTVFLETVVFGTTGGSTTNAPNLTNGDSGSGTPNLNITDGSWFNTLTSTYYYSNINDATGATTQVLGTYVNTLILSTNDYYTGFLPNFTRTQTFTTTSGQFFAGIGFNCPGGTLTLVDSGRIFNYSDTTFALVAGTVDVSNAANAYDPIGNDQLSFGRIVSSNTNTRSINFGSNTMRLSLTTVGTAISMANTAGFTSTGTGGLFVSCFATTTVTIGTTGGSSLTNTCNVYIGQVYNLTITTGSWFNTLSFANTNGWGFSAIVGATSINCSSLILYQSGTFTSMSVTMQGTGSITTLTPGYSAKTIAGLTINNGAGTTTVDASNPISCTTFTMTAGTIDFNNNNLTCSSTATYTAGTLSNIDTISCTTWTISASSTFTLTQGTITPSVSFVLTSGAFNYNGGTLSAVPTFTHTAGTVTLGQSLTINNTLGTYTLTAGTLNLNGYNLTVGQFSSSNTNTRSIVFGTNNIILTSTSITSLSMAIATGFTWDNTSTGGFTSAMSATRTFTFGTTGGSTTNAPNLSLTSGGFTPTFTDGSWFKALDFTGSTCTVAVTASLLGVNVDTLTLATGGTYTSLIPVFTRSQTWTPQYSKQLGGIGFNAAGGTFTLGGAQTYTTTSVTILSAGTIDLGGFDFTTGTFRASLSDTKAINFGANFIILATPTVGATVLDMSGSNTTCSGAGGFKSDASITRTFTQFSHSQNSDLAPNLIFTDSGSAVQTLTTGSYFKNLDFGTTTFTLPTTTLNFEGGFSTPISLTLSIGGTYTGLTVNFIDSPTYTLVTNGKTIAALTLGSVSSSSQTLTLTSTTGIGLTVTGITTLNTGTLVLGGYDLITGTFVSSNSTARSITFGSNNIILSTTTAAQIVLAMATATGFTWDNTSTGGFTSTMSTTRTFQFASTSGGTATNAPNLTLLSGASIATLSSGSWFNTLNFSASAFVLGTTILNLNSLTLSSGGTFTGLTATMVGTGTITSSTGKTILALTINSTSGTTTLAADLALVATGTTILTSGTLNLGNFTLSTGIFNSSNSNTRSINFGTGNIALTHTTAATVVLAIANATGFTWDNTSTGGFTAAADFARTFQFGSTSGGTATNAPNLSITGSGTAIATLTTGSWFKNLNFNSTAFTVPTTALSIAGSLTLYSTVGAVYTGLSVTMVGTGTFTTYGKTIAAFTVNNGAGTTTMLGAIGCTTFTMTAGTIDFAFYTITCSGAFTYTSGTILNLPTSISTTTLTINGTLTMIVGMTIIATVSVVLQSGAFNYNGGTLTTPVFTQTTGAVTLGQALTITGAYTLTAGTLDLGNNNLTVGTFVSSTANTRSIAFGTASITLNTSVAASTVLSMAIVTGFTYTGTGNFISDAAVTRTFVFGTTGGAITNSPNLAINGSGTAIATITTGSWFNTLSFDTTVFVLPTTSLNLESLTLSPGGTFTGLTINMVDTGTITGNSRTIVSMTINHTGTTTIAGTLLTCTGSITLTAGTLTLTANLNLTTTTGAFSSSNTNTRSINFGAFSIDLQCTTLATTVLNMAIVTGFTYTGTGGFTSPSTSTRTFTFGTTGGSITNSPNLTLTGVGTSVSTFTTGSWFNTLSFGSTVFILAATNLNLNGLTLSSGGTFTGLTANMRGTGTINCSGKSTGPLIINNDVGTTTLSAAALCTTFTMTAGTINFATLNLTCSSTATYTAGTLSNIGTITCTTWTCGGTFTLSSGTITPSTSFVVTGGFNFNSGTVTTPVFTHTSGTVTLGASLNLGVLSGYTFTTGTIDLGGNNLTVGQLVFGAGTSARSILFGSNTITLNHSTAGLTVLSMADLTNYSFTGTQTFLSDAAVTRTFVYGTTGGSTTNSPNLTLNGSGTAVLTFTTGSWFNTLNFNTTAVASLTATSLNLNGLTLSNGGTFTGLTANMRGTGTITSNTNTTLGPLIINNGANTTTLAAALVCTTFTMTAGTINFATFNLTCSSTATYTSGTLSNIGTITCTTFTVNGTFTLTQGTITPSVSFVLSSGAFNYNGGTLSAVPTFTHTAGTVTLGKAYALTATGTYTFTAGTLNLNGFDLTTGIFSSSGSGVRSIVFGSNNIILATTTTAINVLDMAIATNFTWDNTSTGGFRTDATTVPRTVTFGTTGGSTTNSPNLTLNGTGTFVITIQTTSWFNKLDFGTTAFSLGSTSLNLNSLTLSATGTYNSFTATMRGTGTITPNGKPIFALTINSTSGTTTLATDFTVNTVANISTTTLTSGTLELANFTLTTGIFSSSNSTTRSINFGTGNIALTHATAATTVLDMGTVTGFTCTATTGGFTSAMTVTRTFQFGVTIGGSSTNAPNLTLTGASIATLSSGGWFNTLNFSTSAFVLGTTTLNLNSLTLNSGGTFTGLTATMVGTGTITSSAGKTILALTINSTSGTTTLATDLALGVTGTTTLTSGTLALGNFTLSTGIFSSNNATTRSISFGTGSISLTHTTAATTVLNMSNADLFTVSGTGGFTSAMSNTRTFTFGVTAGSATNSPNLTLSGASVATLTTGSYFNKVDFTTSTFDPGITTLNLNGLTLSSGVGAAYTSLTVNIVGTGTITGATGKTIVALTINSTSGTTTLAADFALGVTGTTLLTSGTLALGTFTLSTGVFSSDNSTTRSINFGTGSILLTHTTAATVVLSMATATGFTVSGTGGFTATALVARTYTFGTTGGTATNSPNLSITGTGTQIPVLTTASWFNTLSFGDTVFTLAATSLNLNGLTLSTGASVYTNLVPTMVGTGSINTNGKTLTTLVINHTGTTTLASDVTTSTSTTLTSGTLALAGFTLTPTQFISGTAATRAISGAGTGIISLANNWTVSNGTGFTGSDYTINMTKATSKTFAGAGGSYGTLVQAGAGALTISGSNTLADIQATTRPSTITFTAGTTQNVSAFTLEGTIGNLVTINSTSTNSYYVLSKSSGIVIASYLSIRDSIVSGGASWYNDNGTNTVFPDNLGWNPAPGGGINGQFFAFF